MADDVREVNTPGDTYVSTNDWLGNLLSSDNTTLSNIDWGKLGEWLTGQLKSPAGALTGIAALGTLLGKWNQPSKPPGWKGVVGQDALTAVRTPVVSDPAAPYVAGQPVAPVTFAPRAYGEAPRVASYSNLQFVPTSSVTAPAPAPAPGGGNKDVDTGTTGPITTMPVDGLIGGEVRGDGSTTIPTQTLAHGGIADLARGGVPKQPRYLDGPTDGMADKLNTSIDNKEPARLSHGEFVIPADVVSHLGNGNSNAGAQVLYKMMDRVRQARTGTTKQGKRINPSKFTPGGIASYATGGDVKRFDGTNTSTVTSGTSSSTQPSSLAMNPVTQQQNLSEWIGPYVADYMNRMQALSKMPYQAYQGPLTAGTSPLQQKAYEGISAINPSATFDTAAAQQYMNPYLQASLNPQLAEIQRQSDIGQQGLQAKFAQAGAFGGARDAIARAQMQRDANALKAGVIGQGYNTAFNNAMQQYNTAQQQRLQNLNALMGAGTQQQQTEDAAVKAQQAAFQQAQIYPYQQLQFMQSGIQGLPVSTNTASAASSPMQQFGSAVSGLGGLYDLIKNFPGGK